MSRIHSKTSGSEARGLQLPARSATAWLEVACQVCSASRTRSMNRRILSRLFRPGLDSTPLATSTAKGRSAEIASATLSGVRPPARMSGMPGLKSASKSHAPPLYPCRQPTLVHDHRAAPRQAGASLTAGIEIVADRVEHGQVGHGKSGHLDVPWNNIRLRLNAVDLNRANARQFIEQGPMKSQRPASRRRRPARPAAEDWPAG